MLLFNAMLLLLFNAMFIFFHYRKYSITLMVPFFPKKGQQLKVVNYFCEKAPLLTFD